jgi:hypothetical protein
MDGGIRGKHWFLSWRFSLYGLTEIMLVIIEKLVKYYRKQGRKPAGGDYDLFPSVSRVEPEIIVSKSI